MSTGILLSYKGLGANILHLSYCHEIAKAHGPVKIITLSNNTIKVYHTNKNFTTTLRNYYLYFLCETA